MENSSFQSVVALELKAISRMSIGGGSNGGAIYIKIVRSVKIINCMFTKCRGVGSGGKKNFEMSSLSSLSINI